MTDVPTPESATDDHTKGVWIDLRDVCGGFDDAASDKTGLLALQLGGGEVVGEDEVVQTGDPAETVQRDGADFIGNVNSE